MPHRRALRGTTWNQTICLCPATAFPARNLIGRVLVCDIPDWTCHGVLLVSTAITKGRLQIYRFRALSTTLPLCAHKRRSVSAPADHLHSLVLMPPGLILRATSIRIGARKDPWYWIIALPNRDETPFPNMAFPARSVLLFLACQCYSMFQKGCMAVLFGAGDRGTLDPRALGSDMVTF
jgi:hypothetical protein